MDRHFQFLPPPQLDIPPSHRVTRLVVSSRTLGREGEGRRVFFLPVGCNNAETRRRNFPPGPLRPSNGGGGNCVKVDVGYTRAPPLLRGRGIINSQQRAGNES